MTEPAGRHPVHALSHELVERIAGQSPTLATLAGVAGYDHLWDDFSPRGLAEKEAGLREMQSRLAGLPPAEDGFDRLAVRVLREFLQERIEYHASGDALRDLNNIESTFQVLRQVFDVMETATRDGLLAVAARLDGFAAAANGYRDTLARGLELGCTVARRQVRAAVEQGRIHAGPRSFTFALIEACRRSPAAEPALLARLEAGAGRTRSALGALADWLESSYLPAAAAADGVGPERYARAVRRHLGMALDPLETYAWGFAEIRRIEAAMRGVAGEIRPGASVREVTEMLAGDPRRAARLPDEFLCAMRERQERALAQLSGRHFDVPEPIRRIDVRLAPPGGALGAYYLPPSEDFSRPGTVWYSPGDRTEMPLWAEVTTAYHEGFPGHHLQCSMQVWLKDRLSRCQRLFVNYPGSSEGWALYAEQLMFELGFFELPEYVLGMYAAQLLRASRVVADIGLHLDLVIPADSDFHPGERWNFELAVERMRERTFLHREFAESEVTRYLGWPAQAISYKVGQREILALRDEVRRREGPDFDLKRFHDRVVGLGSVGLATLRESVLEA